MLISTILLFWDNFLCSKTWCRLIRWCAARVCLLIIVSSTLYLRQGIQKKQSINEITANLCTVLQIKRDTLNPGTLPFVIRTQSVRDAFNLSRDAINLPRGNVHRRCCKSKKKYGHFDASLTLKITVWQRGAVSREWRARLLYIIV